MKFLPKPPQLLRSEKMRLIQLIFQPETAFSCVAELGELGLLQFRDLNDSTNQVNKRYVNEVRRCDELERILRYVNHQLMENGISNPMSSTNPLLADKIGALKTPNPGELTEIEHTLKILEEDLKENTKNLEILKQNKKELLEIRHVFSKLSEFVEQSRPYQISPDLSEIPETENLLSEISTSPMMNSSTYLSHTTGAIETDKIRVLQNLIWRVCRGNAFLKTMKIDDDLSVFVAFYQGAQLKYKVKKICESLAARTYTIPEDIGERQSTLIQIKNRLDDVDSVLKRTEKHNFNTLRKPPLAEKLQIWWMQVIKAKSSYHVLNQCGGAEQGLVIAEAWVPEELMLTSVCRFCKSKNDGEVQYEDYSAANQISISDDEENTLFEQEPLMGRNKASDSHSNSNSTVTKNCQCQGSVVQSALLRGIERIGATVIPVVHKLSNSKSRPPTYHKTNKITESFQALIDSYGIADYQEINPAVFTIISFPFLFGVMFGDIGHGIIMFLAAAYLISKEHVMKYQRLDDIMQMVFSGRYIVLLMGVFSIYCGVIYNDMFSKSLNMFGTSWNVPEGHHFSETKLDPNVTGYFNTGPYFYGMDPIWQLAKNKIVWSNSFKMKSSVVMGIMQMLFGLILSFYNTKFFNSKLDKIGIFLPRLLFLSSIFVYLVLCIIGKWVFWSANDSDCAPSLLINLINMFMMKKPEVCIGNADFRGTPTNIYGELQYPVQMVLILLALVCIPWMLILKPYVIYKRQTGQTGGNYGQIGSNRDYWGFSLDSLINEEESGESENYEDEHEEHEIQELVIESIIETIEFCLNCISHTASYLRLWALSLAHAQLSEVLWTMLLQISLKMNGFGGAVAKWTLFMFFGSLTVGILICMEGLSAFLHALRLHWVEFQSKFYGGKGHLFTPFCFKNILQQQSFDF